MIPKGQRGRAIGCKRACGGECEVHPGAWGVMASGRAAVIGLSGCWAGMSDMQEWNRVADASCTFEVREALFDFGGTLNADLRFSMPRA